MLEERRRYRGISIPAQMFEEVEKIIKEKPELGYKTVTEFIKNAIREKLQRIRE